MDRFDTLTQVADHIKTKLNLKSEKQKIALIYAFNGTGKTRLSNEFGDEKKALRYNAFLEDLFVWDNENCIFRVDASSEIVELIEDQGLEDQIAKNFKKLTHSKIEPSFDVQSGEITFNFAPGDDRSVENIKISKGEESLFVWSIFYTVLESAISVLDVEEIENRETDVFNNLEYIIFDDPISSIDDTKIITMAIDLIKLIRSLKNKQIKFLMTTHHALFYNIFHTEFSRANNWKDHPFLLSKNETEFLLDEQKDSPFGYHLVIKDAIQQAISENGIEKYHFNLFRGILEKTANFLGYSSWTMCLEKGDNQKKIIRLVNFYSHSKLSELETKQVPSEHKELFKDCFDDFINRFHWDEESTTKQQ